MDPRVFVLICLATASRHQPSAVLEVETRVAEIQNGTWNEADFQPLRDAANSSDWKEKIGKVTEEMWLSFLKAHPEEGWRVFKKIATDEDWEVRQKAAMSEEWPMLLETHNVEAWQLFQKLAKDKEANVTLAAAYSPAWPNLVRSNWLKAWQLFCKLMSDEGIPRPDLLPDFPAWKAFGNVPLTGVAEYLDSFTHTNLQDTAGSVQKMADNGFVHKVKDLQLVTFIANRLQRSANETWLGEMARLPLFAGNAALSASLAKNVWALFALTSNFRIFK